MEIIDCHLRVMLLLNKICMFQTYYFFILPCECNYMWSWMWFMMTDHNPLVEKVLGLWVEVFQWNMYIVGTKSHHMFVSKKQQTFILRNKILTTKIRTPKLPLNSVLTKDSFGVTVIVSPKILASKNPSRSVKISSGNIKQVLIFINKLVKISSSSRSKNKLCKKSAWCRYQAELFTY